MEHLEDVRNAVKTAVMEGKKYPPQVEKQLFDLAHQIGAYQQENGK